MAKKNNEKAQNIELKFGRTILLPNNKLKPKINPDRADLQSVRSPLYKVS